MEQLHTVTVLYFASARTSFSPSLSSETVTLPFTPFPLNDLAGLLVQNHEDNYGLENILKKSAWSVNETIVERENENQIPLMGGEVVAVIPPVSGG